MGQRKRKFSLSPEDQQTKREMVESSQTSTDFGTSLQRHVRRPNPKTDIARVESSSESSNSSVPLLGHGKRTENAKTKSYLAPAFESSPLYQNSLSSDTEEQDWLEGSSSSVKFARKVKVGRKNKDEEEDKGRSSAKSASLAQAFALLPFDPVSYTHLTLPTNREV